MFCRTFLVLPELDDEVGVWESCKSKLTTLPLCVNQLLLTKPWSNSPSWTQTLILYQVCTGDCKTWSLSWLKVTLMGMLLVRSSILGCGYIMHTFDYLHSGWLHALFNSIYRHIAGSKLPDIESLRKAIKVCLWIKLLFFCFENVVFDIGHCSRDGEQLPQWAWELIKMWYVVEARPLDSSLSWRL